MTDYRLGSNINYTPKFYKKSTMNATSNSAQYGIKYTSKSNAQTIYENFIKFLPQGSHIGNYNELK